MRAITTPDGNLTTVFIQDQDYNVMYDASMKQARIMVEDGGDEFVFDTEDGVEDVDAAVTWAAAQYDLIAAPLMGEAQ